MAKNPKHDDYYRKDFASVVYKCFDKKSCGAAKSKIIEKQQLTEELHSVIGKFEKTKSMLIF